MNVFKLLWNGSNLGNITNNVIKILPPRLNGLGEFLHMRYESTDIICHIYKYKDDIPLIIDEIKPIFGLEKIGRHTCLIKNKKYLLSQICEENEYIFNEVENKYDIQQIRETIAFRYIMCITTTGNFLWYRKSSVLSYKDCSINPSRDDFKLSLVIIKKWFENDNNMIYDTIYHMLIKICNNKYNLRYTVRQIVFNISAIILQINKNFIFLANIILNKLNNLIFHME